MPCFWWPILYIIDFHPSENMANFFTNLNALRLLTFVIFLADAILIIQAENTYTELATLNPQQKEALRKFKASVQSSLPHDYMKEDIFLIKFLKFENFHVPKAEHHLKEALKWRSDNRVDEYLKKLPADLAVFQQDFPIYVDGYDKEGRPICEIAFGSWPIRKAAVAGLSKKLILYFLVNCAERASEKIREQQAKGKNVTEFVLLANMEGYSIAEQACPACIPFSVTLATANDRYWPLSASGLWLINSKITDKQYYKKRVLYIHNGQMTRFIRPVMSPSARAAMKVFTANQAEWKPFLEKKVEISQISNWYGEGGKTRDH